MDTLDRLLIKEFFLFFAVIWAALTSLYIGIDFFANFWSFTLPASQVLLAYAYQIPYAMYLFLPVACLMATLLELANMSRQNEIMALYTNGVGPLRIASTFVAAVATVSTVAFVVFDSTVPLLNKRRELVLQGLDPETDLTRFSPRGDIWYRNGRLVYNFGQFVPDTNRIDNLSVYRLDPTPAITEIIHGKQAHYVENEWVIRDGFSVKYARRDPFPTVDTFSTRKGVIPDKPTEFRTLKIQEDMMPLRELRKYIARNASYGLDTTAQRVTYHERTAFIFTPLVLILIGLPFALHPLKTHSMPRSVGFCFFVVFLFLLLFRLTLSMGKGGNLPPFIAGWAPNMLFVILSLVMLTRRA